MNGENANVVGATPAQCEAIFDAGADVITLGNHTWTRTELQDYLARTSRCLRPANFAPQCPGQGFGIYEAPFGKICVVNAMGRFTLDANTDNPFVVVDNILADNPVPLTLVDFHAEGTSEKLAMGYFWTAGRAPSGAPIRMCRPRTGRVLPGGTGYITDLGMTGPAHSVLGIAVDAEHRQILRRPAPALRERGAARASLKRRFLSSTRRRGLPARRGAAHSGGGEGMTIAILIVSVLALAAAAAGLIVALGSRKQLGKLDPAALAETVAAETARRQAEAAEALQSALREENRAARAELSALVQTTMKTYSEAQTTAINQQFRTFSESNRTALDAIRATVQGQLETMQRDNHSQLDLMRQTVDEKLQKTLNDRITQSFQLVNERLQEVYTGLGEMRTLASGVGDLKKVLSNVKTRGILGEYQLGAIIAELLSPEQYEENVVTKPGSTQRVEFAIRLPGENGQGVYLPIDAKFPGDTYSQLVDAYDTGDPAAIAAAQAALETRIKGCAKDIRDKYIDPPNTTDFAIMFLPFEGLYAEVVRMGLVDTLQRQYRVNIAGPTTFAALLNSLQMGFRTLAIQKRSGEVWTVLGAVKTEFETFGTVLEAAQTRIEQTSKELDKLVGVRTRQINRKLKSVSTLPKEDAARLLGDGEGEE